MGVVVPLDREAELAKRQLVGEVNDMNARSYPRSSVLAFPKTTEYACAIERSPRRIYADLAVKITLALSVVVVILAVIYQGAP